MLIVFLIFSIIRTIQSTPTALSDTSISEVDSRSLCQRGLALGMRGTSDIIFSCFATILACTWTAIHPNIPAPTDCGWTILKHRVTTTIYALVAPEMVLYWALKQRIMAKRIADDYNERFAQLDTSATQSFLCCVCESMHKYFHDAPLHLPIIEGDRTKQWTTTHGFFVQMGGFMLSQQGVPIKSLTYHTEVCETYLREGLQSYIARGVVQAPTTTEAEIMDRSKGDIVSKSVVIFQTTWFILQCIGRWWKGLSLTELEVVTLSFALLNGFTYAVWWNKPQSVGLPVYLEKRETNKPNGAVEGNNIEREGPGTSGEVKDEDEGELESINCEEIDTVLFPVPSKRTYFSRKLAIERESFSPLIFWTIRVPYRLCDAFLWPLEKMWLSVQIIGEGDLRVPMFYAAVTRGSDNVIIGCASSFIAVIFGSVHLIPSWSLHFPSLVEMWLWRVAAVITIAVPIVTVLTAMLKLELDARSSKYKDIVGNTLSLQLGIYLACRFLLVTITFTSLRSLPSDAYLSIDWVSSIPHF